MSIAASVLNCFSAHPELGVPVAGHVAYIDRYGHAAMGLQVSGETLHRVPGYSSSAGRALAAFDQHILADTLAVPRRKHTPFTITDPGRLHRILRAARQAGWVSTLIGDWLCNAAPNASCPLTSAAWPAPTICSR